MLCRQAGELTLCVETPLSLSKQHGNHGGFYHSIDLLFPEECIRALDKTQQPGGERFFFFCLSLLGCLREETVMKRLRPLKAFVSQPYPRRLPSL